MNGLRYEKVLHYRLQKLHKMMKNPWAPEGFYRGFRIGQSHEVKNDWMMDGSLALQKALDCTKVRPLAPSSGYGGGLIIRPGAPWPWHSRRRFSPLRRREGPPPQPPTPPAAKISRVLQCFVLFPLFAAFRILGLKMGQHRPQDGPT